MNAFTTRYFPSHHSKGFAFAQPQAISHPQQCLWTYWGLSPSSSHWFFDHPYWGTFFVYSEYVFGSYVLLWAEFLCQVWSCPSWVGGNSVFILEWKDTWKTLGYLYWKVKFSVQNSISFSILLNCKLVDKGAWKENKSKKLP